MGGYSIRLKIDEGYLKVQLIRDDDMGGSVEDEDSVSLQDLLQALVLKPATPPTTGDAG